MLPSKPLKTQEKSLGPVLPAISAPPPGPAGRKGRLMTTFTGPTSGCFKQNQWIMAKKAAGNDDFMTTG